MTMVKGEQHHSAVLTEDKVREIRASYAETLPNGRRAETTYTLGKRFGVSHVSIANIIKGATWAHVE